MSADWVIPTNKGAVAREVVEEDAALPMALVQDSPPQKKNSRSHCAQPEGAVKPT